MQADPAGVGPHRIRLQAAWHPPAADSAWTRSFGRPASVGERVWLVIDRPVACAAALNGRPLPAVVAGATGWRHDVTARLRERNELRLDFGAVPCPVAARDRVPLPESLGVVWLEIDPGG